MTNSADPNQLACLHYLQRQGISGLAGPGLRYHNYPEFSNTLTLYHTYPKICTSPFDCLMGRLKCYDRIENNSDPDQSAP